MALREPSRLYEVLKQKNAPFGRGSVKTARYVAAAKKRFVMTGAAL
jgi:hypothetical protein